MTRPAPGHRPLLAIDSSAAACSAAVMASGGCLLAASRREMTRGHAEALMPIVEGVMREAGLTFGDLGGFGVTTGPGSFTGVRIALAAARGLGLATKLPVIGISTFAAIARAVPPEVRGDRVLVVAIDTRRRDLYVEAYRPSGETLLTATVRTPERLAAELTGIPAVALAGDGAAEAAAALSAAGADVVQTGVHTPDAIQVAALALARLCEQAEPQPARPVYLRGAEATLPRDGGRLRP